MKKGINKFRDDCRGAIRNSDLTDAHKLVLMCLVDYLHRVAFTAWPALSTLAEDVGVHRRTVIRAINAARQLGLLKRIHRGGKTGRGGTSNRYTFNLAPEPQRGDTPVTPSTASAGSKEVTRQSRRGDTPVHQEVTRQSPNLLKDLHETLGAASSSGLRAVVGSAEEKEKIEMMRKFPSSDSQASEPAASEAKGSSEEERKRKVDAVFAELAAHGIDRSQSRWGRKNVVPTDAFRPVAITPVTAEVPTTPELRRYCGASTWATPTLTEIPYTPGLRREIDPEDEPDEEQRELTEAEVVLATEIITRLGGPVAVHGTQAALADLMGRLVEHFGCPEAATVAITQGNIILTAQHVLH